MKLFFRYTEALKILPRKFYDVDELQHGGLGSSNPDPVVA